MLTNVDKPSKPSKPNKLSKLSWPSPAVEYNGSTLVVARFLSFFIEHLLKVIWGEFFAKVGRQPKFAPFGARPQGARYLHKGIDY
jgi:hypothetical protein